jgi:hypothetical protein
MEKKLTVAFVLVFLLFLFCSCRSDPVVWDSSLPEESMATVRFVNMKIDSFNGIGVTDFEWVKIPAGEARMGGDVSIYHAGFSFQLKGMEFTCYFEKGREYIVQGGTQETLWGVSVYEASSYSDVSAETRLAFIPFRTQPQS